MAGTRVAPVLRAQWVAAALAALVVGCGGGGSDAPAAAPLAPPQVTISFAASQVSSGATDTLTWSSSNATSCTASGSWTGPQPVAGALTFSLPAAGSFSYRLDCTGGGGTASGEAVVTVLAPAGPAPVPVIPVTTAPPAVAANNVQQVTVDRGPTGESFNMPFVSVTVCSPGTGTCRSVDRVLVDTGSTGLRLIASAFGAGVDLPVVTNAAGGPVGECAQFASGFAWGSVRRADVRLAGETANGISVQLIGDTAAPFNTIPASCSSTGSDLGTVSTLGANGILGAGMTVKDCGSTCTTSTAPRIYYACSAAGCTPTLLPLQSQLSNPVASFAVNNNGLSLQMPPVPVGGSSTLQGTLTFGIGTQANNQLGQASIYPTNSRGEFTTVYKGVSYPTSFIDSGSNGLFFADASIPTCSGSFYCPATPLSLTAMNVSPNGATATVNFTVETARTLTTGISAHNLGGTLGLERTFDFGLPFFFGRKVAVAIQGAQTPVGLGPYWAY